MLRLSLLDIFTVLIVHDEHDLPGDGRVDCIGRCESGRAYWEIASQFQGIRITPNLYTTLGELDRFCDQMEAIARKGLPAS